MSVEVQTNITNVFSECQSSSAKHKSHAENLKRMFLECVESKSTEDFVNHFIKCVDKIFLTIYGNLCTTRVFEFVVTFIKLLCVASNTESDSDSESEEEELVGEFVDNMILRYLPGFESANKNIRLLSTKLVGDISSVALLTDEIQADIQNAALIRTKDIDSRIRVNSVIILSRFGANDVICDAFGELMAHDPSAEVRLTVIYNSIGLSSELREKACIRVKDESFAVRKAMFYKILPGVDIKQLSISSRERIVQDGLSDRDDVIREGAEMLVAMQWVRMCNNNVSVLLQKFDVMGRPEVADSLVQAFFRVRTDIAQIFVVDQQFLENLTVEDCILLRGFQDFCIQTNFSSLLDEKMPDLVVLADHLGVIWHKYTDEESYELNDGETIEDVRDYYLFMIEQLLLVCSRYDSNQNIDDPVARKRLTDLIVVIMKDQQAISEKIMDYIVAIEYKLNDSSDSALLTWAFELVDSAPAPATQDSDESVVANLLHALLLFRSVLSYVNSAVVIGFLPTLYDNYLQAALSSPIQSIRVLGMNCLALGALLDYGFMCNHADVFLDVMFKNTLDSDDVDDPELELSFNAVTDFMLYYTQSNPKTLDIVMKMHEAYQNGKPSKTTAAAVSSLIRLYLTRKTEDPEVLSHLILSYFESGITASRSFSSTNSESTSNDIMDTEKYGELQRQQLSVFIQAFALTPYGKVLLARVFGSVFDLFVSHANVNRGTTISISDLANQYLQILDSTETQTALCHALLAVPIIRVLLTTRSAPTRKSLMNILSRLQITEEVPKDVLVEIKQELEMTEDCEYSTVRTSLEKFGEKINTIMPETVEEYNANKDQDTEMSDVNSTQQSMHTGLGITNASVSISAVEEANNSNVLRRLEISRYSSTSFEDAEKDAADSTDPFVSHSHSILSQLDS